MTINHHPLSCAVPISSFQDSVGKPTRTGPSVGMADVLGHYGRAHAFDNHGLLMLEHHETSLITSIELCGKDPDGIQTTNNPFQGKLSIGGLQIRIGDPLGNLDNSEIHFESRYPTFLSADVRSSDRGGYTIGVSVRPSFPVQHLNQSTSVERRTIGSILILLHHPSKLDRAARIGMPRGPR